MKHIPLKLLLKLLGAGLFIFFVGPPVLKAIDGLINTLNPIKAIVERLKTDNDVLRRRNGDFIVERDSLNEALQIAHTANVTGEKKLNEALQRVNGLLGERGNLINVIDSLRGNLIGVSEGSGSVVITEAGHLIENRYVDDWLDLRILGRLPSDTSLTGKEVYDSVRYDFSFGVGDVRIELKDEGNNQQTIYSVWIQSLRNPSNRRYLDNYIVSETILKPTIQAWDWWDFRAMLAFQGIGNTQGLIGVVPFSFNPAPDRGEDGNLLRFPVIALMSDFNNDHRIGALVSVNVGYTLPVFQNLHILGGYSWGRDGFVVFGIGAAL